MKTDSNKTPQGNTQGNKNKSNGTASGTLREQLENKQFSDIARVQPASTTLTVPTLSSDEDILKELAMSECTEKFKEELRSLEKMLMTRVGLLAAILQKEGDFFIYKKTFVQKEKEAIEAIRKISIDEERQRFVCLFMESIVDSYPENYEAVSRIVNSGLALNFFQKSDRKTGKGLWLLVTREDGVQEVVSLNVPNSRSVPSIVLKLEKLRDRLQKKQLAEAKAYEASFYHGADSGMTALYDSLESNSKESMEVIFDVFGVFDDEDAENTKRGTARIRIEDGVIYPVSGLGDCKSLFGEMTLENDAEEDGGVICISVESVSVPRLSVRNWYELTPAQQRLLKALHRVVRLGMEPQKQMALIRKEATLTIADLGVKGKPGFIALLAKKAYPKPQEIIYNARVLLKQNSEGQVLVERCGSAKDQQHYYGGVKTFLDPGVDAKNLPRALGNLVRFCAGTKKPAPTETPVNTSDPAPIEEPAPTGTDATSDPDTNPRK